MPPTIPSARAAAQGLLFRPSHCTRYASTETTAIPLDAAPAQSMSASKRASRNLSFSEQMHRAIYPGRYQQEGQAGKVAYKASSKPRVQYKRIQDKWNEDMKKKGIATHLSKRFGIPIYKPTALNIKKTCPNPIAAVTASQTAVLDPTGARTRLFSKENPERARVGDILLVRQRTGEPFAGVCINIRRRGVDTAILLRGQLTRVGVEMWYKVYSPLVEGIEVVQRAAKRARRARLTYMRTVKHDRGSVENVVRMYLRQKAALGTAEGQKKKGDAAKAAMMGGGKKHKGRGKRR
ncbi:hypothetical protein ACN47E_005617 [Coniothyrium glycines]